MTKEPTYKELRKKAISLIKRESKKHGKDFICLAYISWIELFKITPDEVKFAKDKKQCRDERREVTDD